MDLKIPYNEAIFLLLAFFICYSSLTQAQGFGGARHKMAIFTPLYIDEAFDNAGSYKYSGKTFPKQSINGLEFYHGASLAIDSLNKLSIPLDVYIYDTKSKKETLEQQFSKCAADGVELIIANCSLSELTTLARLGLDKKITVLNATVPNDANTTNNPYFVVMNPTIQTQLERLYNYIKTKYPGKQITVITKKAPSEKYIRSVFETLNTHYKNAINFNFREVNDDIALKALGTTTQPTEAGLYVIGSLDTEFGKKILAQFAQSSKNYASLTLIGMPTWENIDLTKTDYKGVEVIYSTPFYNARTDAASRYITSYYSKKMYARPSDLVFRAYGLTYRFGHLLNRYGKDINNKLAGTEYRAFFDMEIQPDYLNGKISHYENKKLYYLKYFNGALKAVN
ncbi:ABC transporter substrate-binding protein [Niabella ginsengisoli]|uniref:ABC transporter substrate-binding protein n=1 Tax=Niabella ginsengisoli TaxID=522298 RepID=A0ABS9SP42_9BACT|nr:ABC transporter substrate-binding protein [Niabella ginsengisoli]MCH5600148.1 ABC transporter substrate-binding protein [Niabella ginsengisoli]